MKAVKKSFSILFVLVFVLMCFTGCKTKYTKLDKMEVSKETIELKVGETKDLFIAYYYSNEALENTKFFRFGSNFGDFEYDENFKEVVEDIYNSAEVRYVYAYSVSSLLGETVQGEDGTAKTLETVEECEEYFKKEQAEKEKQTSDDKESDLDFQEKYLGDGIVLSYHEGHEPNISAEDMAFLKANNGAKTIENCILTGVAVGSTSFTIKSSLGEKKITINVVA